MLKLPEIGAVLAAQLKRPETIAGTAFLAVGIAIATNALFFQTRPHPAPLFATRAQSTQTTESGDPLVRDIQAALAASGLYTGVVDGFAGPQTETAIRSFEQSAGLPQTGQASISLLAEIRAASASKSTPEQGDPLVASVQNALALSAYGPLIADGIVGPDTRSAIMRFQRDHNLPVTGEISDNLVIELRAAGAMHDI